MRRIFDFRFSIFDAQKLLPPPVRNCPVGLYSLRLSLFVLLVLVSSLRAANAQQTNPPIPNPSQQPGAPPIRLNTPLGPGGPGGPPRQGPGGAQTAPDALPPDVASVTYDEFETYGQSGIRGKNVVIILGEYTLAGERLEGDLNKELVFTGNPKLTYRGQTVTGDSIRFNPKTKAYKIENLHTALSPDFLKGRLLSPLYLSGADIMGLRKQPIIGDDIDATTCDKDNPDYLFRATTVIVEPGKRLILKKATFYLWGHRIITLPTVIIPLDRQPRPFRANHLPQVGRSQDEGYFVKTTFNTLLADRMPGLLHLDLMEKKGIGIGTEQVYNFAKVAGALALYTIPTGGTGKNLSGRIDHRQNIGGGQTLTLNSDYQKNSYLALPATTNFNNRFGYNRIMEGWNTTFNLSRQATDSTSTSVDANNNPVNSTYSTRTITSNFSQGIQLGRTTTLNFSGDYSSNSSISPGFGGAAGLSQHTEQLSTRFQGDQRADNYLLQVAANKNVPIGKQTQSSFFGGVEKLPEITLSNYRFTQGFLSKVPATFLISAGKYSEGGTLIGSGGGNSQTSTERVVTGIDINNTRISLSPRTDLNIAGGFQQFFYGKDGTAQYIVRNNTTLSQRWNKHSGVNFNYTYQQPEGGTPFRFDQQSRYNALNADMGMLDDRRVQLTARVGYDFGQTSFGNIKTPWQTLSTNLLIRPVDWARFRSLMTFDPNTGKFVSATADLRFRGHNDFSFDMVGRFDPQRHKFGQINSYFNLPIGRLWRVIGLFQYNGYLSKFESRNLQIVRDLHCMEASLTYVDNPFGFRSDKQIFFQLRIKAFPVFQKFGVGQFGQAIDTSVGDIY